MPVTDSLMVKAQDQTRRRIGFAVKLCLGVCLAGMLVAAQRPPERVKPSPPATQAASAEAGRKLFIRCAACHSVSAASPVKGGPHLEGIVGRRVASDPRFRYTTAIRDHDYLWTKPRLDHLLRQPQAVAPGLCLPFTGFARQKDRDDLIAYLERPLS